MILRRNFYLLPLLLLCIRALPQDGHVEDESIFDLFKISSISRKTIGAKLFKGHDWDSPAYRFIRFDHIPAVSTPALHQILKQVQNNEGFVFVATIRQDKGSRGTLFGLEGPSGSRQFEIMSNGRANTLDLLYMVGGSQNVVSFEDVDLSDSQWKNITLYIHGENAHLYVGCSLIDSVILDEPFYEHLRSEGSQMFVAKGSIRENHFREVNVVNESTETVSVGMAISTNFIGQKEKMASDVCERSCEEITNMVQELKGLRIVVGNLIDGLQKV
ncbi:thrombospondin-2-like, partial [Sinocyclocheilus grahami]|uniref:thrombospondin-2-like n=1 Tax=Sinocyclocheilus grahami TaxID=75366 RepID=UPI0007AC7F79